MGEVFFVLLLTFHIQSLLMISIILVFTQMIFVGVVNFFFQNDQKKKKEEREMDGILSHLNLVFVKIKAIYLDYQMRRCK